MRLSGAPFGIAERESDFSGRIMGRGVEEWVIRVGWGMGVE